MHSSKYEENVGEYAYQARKQEDALGILESNWHGKDINYIYFCCSRERVERDGNLACIATNKQYRAKWTKEDHAVF